MVDTADNDFPEGWAVVDGEIAIDEAWLARVEAKEKHMNVEQRAAMVQAKRTELESYFSNQVWQFAEDGENRAGRTVSARWVLSWKESENGGPPKAKARLVLRGFEDPDLMNIEKASPTATRQSKMLLLAFAGNWQWVVFCGDVRTAFLSGAEFNRKIVVKAAGRLWPAPGSWPAANIHADAQVSLRAGRRTPSVVERSGQATTQRRLGKAPARQVVLPAVHQGPGADSERWCCTSTTSLSPEMARTLSSRQPSPP